VAAWLALRDYLQKQIPPVWRSQLLQIFQATPSKFIPKSSDKYLILLSLQLSHSSLYGKNIQNKWMIHPYFLKESNIPGDFLQYNSNQMVSGIVKHIASNLAPRLHIQKLTQHVDPSNCINENKSLANLTNLIVERDCLTIIDSEYPIHDYLSLLVNLHVPFFTGSDEQPFQTPIKIHLETGEVRIKLEKKSEGITIKPIISVGNQKFETDLNEISIINESPAWILIQRSLVWLSNPASLSILKNFNQSNEILIEKQQEDFFQEKYFLELSQKFNLDSNFIQWETIETIPNIRLYLDDVNDELQVQLCFVYQDLEVPYHPYLPSKTIQNKPGTWNLFTIIRQPEKEHTVFKKLSSTTFGLKRIPAATPCGKFRLRARVHPIDFLLNTIPKLTDLGYEIIGEQALKTARVNRNTPSISFDVSSGIDWFDVKTVVSFGELEVSLKDLRKVIQKNQSFIKLPDGTIGEIPNEWFDKYQHLFNLGKTKGDKLRFAQHQITLLDEVLEGEDKKRVDQTYQNYRQSLQTLRTFENIREITLPEGFTGELRPYQKAGFNWLHFLRDFNFGGCLADDMGLGKTIQTLAFLISIYENRSKHNPASLLIVPRSLIINWQREVEQFAPDLRVMEYLETNRQKETSLFDQVDLIVSTYGILLRDIEFLHGYRFYYAILDESQAIKNPNSQTARAAHLIDAKHKLVLTGTPIENSTSELWSQFAFLNPGLLGSHRYFKKVFSNPIEKEGNQEVIENLRKIIFPFVLRRTKDQVAPELPPRSEKIIYCNMEAEQRELYNQTRDYYRGLLLGMLETEGIDKSRFKILEGLLRLRQIANHPFLVNKKTSSPSGKFDLLMDTLTTLKAEGHKALVFSQFVQMLKLVRNELDSQKISYTYLDGATLHRQEQIDIFQENDDIPFFLISLKAGGLGLNLTAADYVIHIDPWWNPAVEMQASDRTHRIGQEKPVFVFKMISRNTVEEKILTLQERKRNLVDQIITTESSFFKNLSRAEIESFFTG